ncbi:MAG: c-type cytochrome [Gemmatimonadetes bacterium]|nr:c-type cytochrome [Gemmatimonadota bacterium]
MNRKLAGLLVVLLCGLPACNGEAEDEPEVPREELLRAARADSVAQATAMYDATVFDTLTWESENARYERGGVVWAFSCQRCHGSDGAGKGEDAVKFEIAVPDMTAADWPYAGDYSAIRERIFVGHETEMPSMGLIGLAYSDVDASAHYINDLLRAPQ